MSHSHRLGMLRVGTATRGQGKNTPQFRRRRFLNLALPMLTVIIVLGLAAGALWAGKALAAQVTPQRIVLRGCWLSSTEDVLTALAYRNDSTIAEMDSKAKHLNKNNRGWLRHIDVKQAYPRTALVEIDERCPLLKVTVGTDTYLLCDDKQLVVTSDPASLSTKLDHLQSLPAVELKMLPEDYSGLMEQLLLTAACLTEVLPGRVDAIMVDHEGEFSLRMQNNLRVLLGAQEHLPEKIGALPKALRLVEDHYSKLVYLDARNPHVFYEVWQESISK
jgi:cell division septal protein FtsQ